MALNVDGAENPLDAFCTYVELICSASADPRLLFVSQLLNPDERDKSLFSAASHGFLC